MALRIYLLSLLCLSCIFKSIKSSMLDFLCNSEMVFNMSFGVCDFSIIVIPFNNYDLGQSYLSESLFAHL